MPHPPSRGDIWCKCDHETARPAAGRQTEAVADTFREREYVEASEDLPGVPEGTAGEVVGVSGLSWIRYRVRFSNGIERNLIDGSHLRPWSG